MQVAIITLKNFRNLDLQFTPSPGVNILLGPNGAGKSNFLDTLYYCAYGRSFRKYEDEPVNYHAKDRFASIELELTEPMRILKLVFTEGAAGVSKQYYLNGKSTSVSKFRAQLQAILFAPYNINLLSGTPDVRRDEFDQFLGLLDSRYLSKLKEYRSVVRNRNSLLGEVALGRANSRELDFWNEKLVSMGCELISRRIELLEKLEPFVEEQASVLTGQLKALRLRYSSKLASEDGSELAQVFTKKLLDNKEKELRAGVTLYGPHRDDYEFWCERQNLQLAGSRGQQRIAALMTKLAMWQLLTARSAEKPLLLLDDVFSELDIYNRAHLQHLVKKMGVQTFISATESDHFDQELLGSAKVFQLGK